jgi:hypothetical protein
MSGALKVEQTVSLRDKLPMVALDRSDVIECDTLQLVRQQSHE